MKKVLVSVLATVCIMGTGCAGYINHITTNYESKIQDCNLRYKALENKYDQQVAEYDEIESEHQELEDGVYALMNKDDYEIRIRRDGKTHIYTSEKQNFLFTKKSHTTVG